MGEIKSEIQDEPALLEKFGVDKRFDSPGNYSERNSFFGDGKYPPDWSQRRSAVWWLQDGRCARCGRSHDRGGHVHHVKPLAKGGPNSLDNLVGLCVDCHALLHPRVDDLDGDWKRAPKYPCEKAEPEVAVIRRSPDAAVEKRLRAGPDFEKLAAETEPRENLYATQSLVVYATSPAVARQLAQDPTDHPTENDTRAIEELNRLLLLRGRVPENGLYSNRRLSVETPVPGVLGWLSAFAPTVTVEPESENRSDGPTGPTIEETAPGEFVLSEDVTAATVTVTDGAGEVSKEEVSFTEGGSTQSVSIPVSPPPASATGHYVRSVVGKSHLLTIAYVLLWLLVVPVTGLVLLASLMGAVFGSLGTVGWLAITLLSGGSWTRVAELAVATVAAFLLSGIAITVLEQFGIDFGE